MAVIQSLACQYKEEGKKEFLERNAKREWNQSRFIRGGKKGIQVAHWSVA
jgi:hypothetical protein